MCSWICSRHVAPASRGIGSTAAQANIAVSRTHNVGRAWIFGAGCLEPILGYISGLHRGLRDWLIGLVGWVGWLVDGLVD